MHRLSLIVISLLVLALSCNSLESPSASSAAGNGPTQSADQADDTAAKVEAVGRTNASMTFVVHCGSKALDRSVQASLAVSKPGKTSIVNGTADEGQVDGRHTFYEGMTAKDVVAYYKRILEMAGWRYSSDFVDSGTSIHFYGISKLGSGTNREQLKVYGATDSQSIRFNQLELSKD